MVYAKTGSYLFFLSPLIMIAQDSKSQDNLINEQFDKLILNDQKRTVTAVAGIPSDAVIFQCSDPVLKYNPEMEFGRGFLKSVLESPLYTEAAKIQFIKDGLADTSREEHDGDPVGKFTFITSVFWRLSKESTALINASFDKQLEKIKASEESDENKKSEEEYIELQRLRFVTRMQLPESYQMITDFIKNRPNCSYKWDSEPFLVYRLVQMGKEKEGLDYLEEIIDDLINDRPVKPFFSFNYGVFDNYNLFYFLCLSENEAVAKRATDLLFRLMSKKIYDPYILNHLAAYVDKVRYDQLDDSKKVKRTYDTMPEEKIHELIADLNTVAVKCNLPEIRLNKLSEFLISDNNARNVIDEFLQMNNLIIEFHRYIDAPEGAPIDYVKLFTNKFSQIVNAQHCNDFTIGQVTEPVNGNGHNYNLFVKYNKSGYNHTWTEQDTTIYTHPQRIVKIDDPQRLIKMLNLCLIENKEKKRFITRISGVGYEFVLMEPAALMPLSKKYNLGFFAIEEGDTGEF